MKEKRNFARTGSFMTQASAKNSWVHYADAGTSLEDVLRPNYWCNVAGKFRLFDKIEIIFQDLNVYGEFVVMGIENMQGNSNPNRTAQYANISLLNSVNLIKEVKEVKEKKEVKEYSAKYLNPAKRYAVINNINNTVVEENIQSKEEAEEKVKQLISINE